MSNQDSKRLQLLRLLAENPRRSQRELSRHMGVALGSVNYCLTGLIDKGYIKLENFRHAIKAQIQTLGTELADQNPELLSDLDFKDILTPSPTSQT